MKRQDFEIEVCVDSVTSTLSAEKGGADRIELCSNLYEGGTTPSAGMIIQVKKQTSLKVFSIIRPRGKDFFYSEEELEIMINDINMAYQIGIDGFVLGCLTIEGKVDYEKCSRLIEATKGLPVTFHRAFDMTDDAFEALNVLKKLGVKRVLTSGQKKMAIEGIPLIAELVKNSGNEIKIMPGSGINEDNIVIIAQQTQAKAFHVSLRQLHQSPMQFRREGIWMGRVSKISEYNNEYTSTERLRILIDRLKSYNNY